jgi:hypothetical protein
MAASSIDVAAVAAYCNGRSLMPAKAYLALMRRANAGNEGTMPPLAKPPRKLQDDTRRLKLRPAFRRRLAPSIERLSAELEAVRARANTAEARADIQQQRLDLAAKELAKVSARLQAAVDALRLSI